MPGSTLSPTSRTSGALIKLLMLCSASFFLNGGRGPLLKGLFNAKLYCYFFYYLFFKVLYAHAAHIALAMPAYRNSAVGFFFFADNEHIRYLFDFSVAYFATNFFVSVVNKPANIGIF